MTTQQRLNISRLTAFIVVHARNLGYEQAALKIRDAAFAPRPTTLSTEEEDFVYFLAMSGLKLLSDPIEYRLNYEYYYRKKSDSGILSRALDSVVRFFSFEDV